MTNPARAWLAEFRLMNLELRRSLDGRPLYSYQVTQSEYLKLTELLRKKPTTSTHSAYIADWAACFCLYVAENFRREYDGSSGWSWDPIWQKLGYELPVQEYQQLVEIGLKKWQRPMRYYARGRNLLGSLFAEGGLPWPLVQTDHGFGVLVRKGLARYYDSKAIGQPLTALMSEYAIRLPLSFRTLETYQLLAGIVEQLIYLVERYPLQNQADPAAYMDKEQANWRSEFPIPLDEQNARTLINEWLKNANEQRQQHSKKSIEDQVLHCTHQLIIGGSQPSWKIISSVHLPKKMDFPTDCSQLTSTRFDLVFYEGERMVRKAGAAYAELDVELNQVQLTILSRKYDLERHAPHEQLKLVFFQSGVKRHTMLIEDSALLLGQRPVVFEPKHDEWMFLRQASCRTPAQVARIHLPARCIVSPDDYTLMHTQADGSTWIEVTQDTLIQVGTDKYRVKLQQTTQDAHVRIMGQMCLYHTIPSLVYHGLPDVRMEGQGEVPKQWSVEINGRPVKLPIRSSDANFVGRVEYRVLGEEQESLARDTFGVLPAGFSITAHPCIGQQPAKLVIKQAQALPLTITDVAINFSKYETSHGIELHLTPKPDCRPSTVTVRVGSPNAPVSIVLPYPHEGAELIDEQHQRVTSNELSLDQLLGLTLIINSAAQNRQKATIELSLIHTAGTPIKRSFTTQAYHASISLSLFSYQEDIMQMISVSDDQDAYVEVCIIQSGKFLKKLNIRRYQSALNKVSSQYLTVMHASTTQARAAHTIELRAMRLADPQQENIQIPAVYSDQTATGEFEIVADLERDGPWLIFSTPESTTATRPFLYTSQNPQHTQHEAPLDVKSLHHAAELFHPFYQPHLIRQQIENMSSHLEHSGWLYLSELKSRYSHLSLSTFEAWRELARQPHALALGLFRLEFDYAFCERMQQELAVVWDEIAIQVWVSVYAQFKAWLFERGLPEALITQLLENREQTLHGVVSGFEYIKSYLKEPIPKNLQPTPLAALSIWYQQLRHRNANEMAWPDVLGDILKSWVSRQNLPQTVKNLSVSNETDAVIYLPVFMAHVSTGRARLDDLQLPLHQLKFQIGITADFDRIGWYTPVHAMMVCYLLAQPACVSH